MLETNIDYENVVLEFEECSVKLPADIIEKFQTQKVEQFIEKKYNPEDEFDIYIVINRILAEELWKNEFEEIFKRFFANRYTRI